MVIYYKKSRYTNYYEHSDQRMFYFINIKINYLKATNDFDSI